MNEIEFDYIESNNDLFNTPCMESILTKVTNKNVLKKASNNAIASIPCNTRFFFNPQSHSSYRQMEKMTEKFNNSATLETIDDYLTRECIYKFKQINVELNKLYELLSKLLHSANKAPVNGPFWYGEPTLLDRPTDYNSMDNAINNLIDSFDRHINSIRMAVLADAVRGAWQSFHDRAMPLDVTEKTIESYICYAFCYLNYEVIDGAVFDKIAELAKYCINECNNDENTALQIQLGYADSKALQTKFKYTFKWITKCSMIPVNIQQMKWIYDYTHTIVRSRI